MGLFKELTLLKRYQSRVESAIEHAVQNMGPKTQLRDACEYALLSGGKRLRPVLVLMIVDALDQGLDAIAAALSVEFFHTSSLIADDLPCMDNDDERRGRSSLHKVFDEGIALLASYTLIASGYEGIYKNGKLMKQNAQYGHLADAATLACLEIATRCAGIFGATNGQFLDLFPPDNKLETIERIIFQKTVTLFQISFVFGWLFGGGNVSDLPLVEKTAYHLGMAFQIADDLQDAEQDFARNCPVNIAAVIGQVQAVNRFNLEMSLFEQGLRNLGLWNNDFEQIVMTLKNKGKGGI